MLVKFYRLLYSANSFSEFYFSKIASIMDAIYLEASDILRRLELKETSFKKLIFDSFHANKKQLYKICYETVCRKDGLEKILLKVPKLCQSEHFLENKHLLFVLLYEHLFGKGLQQCPYEWRTAIEMYDTDLAKLKNMVSSNPFGKEMKEKLDNKVRLPRYARVNTLKISVESILEDLQRMGWKLLQVDSTLSRKKYRQILDDLSGYNFLVDIHIPDVLVFPFGTDLHREPLVQYGCLTLQDKSSCLPTLCLECHSGLTILDMCSAPGVKSSHIASMIKNNGQIFAYDKDYDRCRVMEEILNRNAVECVEFDCRDILQLNFSDKKYCKVSHVILDPPCSGSGMVRRMDFLTNSSEEIDEQRLRRLANLQSLMLKHAFTLPNLKRLVYSTCSIYEQENESVVEEALTYLEGRFRLANAMPSWKHRGKRQYDFGKMCLRASAEKDRTNGFFVAVFEKCS